MRLIDDGFMSWLDELLEEVIDDESGERAFVPLHRQKFTLTTAHLNQDPSDNRLENLKALCAPCHLNYDRAWLGHNRMRKQERKGQLILNFPFRPGEK